MVKKITFILILIGAIILLFLPIVPVQVVPEVTLKVVDTEGKPLPNIKILQFWRHWTYDATNRHIETTSNSEGYVTFSQKQVWTSPFRFLYGKFGEYVWSYIDIHASFGPHNGFRAEDFRSKNKWCYPDNVCRTKKRVNEIVVFEKNK